MKIYNNAHAFARNRLWLGMTLALFGSADAAEPWLLEAVQIEAKPIQELSPATTRLQGESLETLQKTSGDTASLLRMTPGVSLNAAGGVSSLPAIHGLADDRLRIKVDGMDLIASCPNHMNPPLSYLDPSNVASLAVYPGIAPVSLGGESIGGTIAATTVAPEFADRHQLSVALTKHLTSIASVASNAPYIGLLGTVLGILVTFHDLSLGEGLSANAVMLGLALALKATAAGLLVAIPATLAYNGLLRRVDVLTSEWASQRGEP